MQRDRSPCGRQDDETFLRERDLALRWHKSIRSLQRWRMEGSGPAYVRLGGSIRYRLSDVRAYEAAARSGGEAAARSGGEAAS